MERFAFIDPRLNYVVFNEREKEVKCIQERVPDLRYIAQGEDEPVVTVRKLESKYNISLKWGKIKDMGHSWLGYVIG